MIPLQRDDRVVYLAHPDWDIGIIEFVAPNGLLTVRFEIDGQLYRDDFSAHELEMAPQVKAAA